MHVIGEILVVLEGDAAFAVRIGRERAGGAGIASGVGGSRVAGIAGVTEALGRARVAGALGIASVAGALGIAAFSGALRLGRVIVVDEGGAPHARRGGGLRRGPAGGVGTGARAGAAGRGDGAVVVGVVVSAGVTVVAAVAAGTATVGVAAIAIAVAVAVGIVAVAVAVAVGVEAVAVAVGAEAVAVGAEAVAVGVVAIAVGVVAVAVGVEAVVVAGAGVEAAAGGGRGEAVVGVGGGVGVEVVEEADEVAGLGELAEIDLAAADEVKDDLAELGEGVVAAAPGAGFVEARAAGAGAALDGVADGAGLGEGGAEQRAEGAPELGGPEAAAAALSSHGKNLHRLSGRGTLSYRRAAVQERRLAVVGLLAVGGLVVLAACPPPEPPAAPIPPVSAGKVRVRVFTEPAPVRILASAGKFVFVGTDSHLERWDDGGSVLPLSAEHGLSGSQIVALAADPDRRWVWILTDGGLGYYDAGKEVYREQLAPPSSMSIDFAALAKEGASMTPAKDGGVWLGTHAGLIYVSAKGGWAATSIKEPIRALARDHGGWLWLATKDGLVARKPTGETMRVGAAQGCGIADPRLLVEMPGDRVLVIGTDEAGQERLAIGKQLAWTTYRALPEVKWDAAAHRKNGAVVMGGDRLYRISPNDGGVRPLSRDGMRLVPIAAGAQAEWVIDPLDVVTPPGATSLAAADDLLLIGTRELGTARYHEGEARPRDWLRRRQMFRDATTLSVACAKETDCWIATGARQAWHWNGERFVASGPDQVVLAVVRDPAGSIYALHRAVTDHAIKLSKIDGETWTPVKNVALVTAGGRAETSFARFASSGSLWVGLRYLDGEERRAYGIAIIETATGKVSYHRTESVADKKAKMLPVPVGVVDADVRGDTAWFATNEGVARLADGEVTVWTEATGLRSELARAVAIAADGSVIVATGAGAGRWDGKAWAFPGALQFEINDVVVTRNGQLWMATERGIAAWDGMKVRRVDMRRGLAENHILDIAADQFDRLWARGPGSLTLISQ